MSGNTFGTMFRITTWGESHGSAVGVVVDGCPAGLALDAADIQKELDRRRPGQSRASTARQEADRVEILSGIFEGKTTGTPISLLVWNKDADSSAYDLLRNKPRPGHADYAYQMKYGMRDHRGGGRASARETVGRVAAGAVAKKLLQAAGVQVVAYVTELGGIKAEIASSDLMQLQAQAESNAVRCPDPAVAERMLERLDAVRQEGDSLAGSGNNRNGRACGSWRARFRQAGRRPGPGAHEHRRREGGGDRRGPGVRPPAGQRDERPTANPGWQG